MAYTIRPLLLGKMLINSSLFTYMMNFQKDIWIPIVSWYIKAEDKNVLIDTGASAELMRKIWYSDYEEVTSFEEALKSVGTSPEDIDIVIQTHLHFDHCGNTPKCRNAQVIVQADELAFSRKPHPLFLGSYLRKGALDGVNFKEVEGDVEVLPGIKVYKVPGHSPGPQAISVETDKGKAVLSGFCAIRANFSPPEKLKKIWPVLTTGVHTDSLQAFESAVRVKDLGDIIVPIHDMELATKEQLP
jgi:glyoxylase-like metal-dependent hydrolase (beta-lactamase superfamily II)